LILAPNAPHFGPMFDEEEIREIVMSFLKKELKVLEMEILIWGNRLFDSCKAALSKL